MLNREQTENLIKEIIEKQSINDLKTWRWLLMKELMASHRSELDGSLVNEIINNML
jgi:Glu-tRNA(Gln) amidotransferase subunit E-like FAD-binding protein